MLRFLFRNNLVFHYWWILESNATVVAWLRKVFSSRDWYKHRGLVTPCENFVYRITLPPSTTHFIDSFPKKSWRPFGDHANFLQLLPINANQHQHFDIIQTFLQALNDFNLLAELSKSLIFREWFVSNPGPATKKNKSPRLLGAFVFFDSVCLGLI